MRLAVIPLGAMLLLSACAPDPFLEAGRKRNQEISERVMRLAELRAICAGNPEMLGRALTPAEALEQTLNISRLKSLAPDIWPDVPLFHPRVEEMRQACAGDPDRNISGRPMTAAEWNEALTILYPAQDEQHDSPYPTGTFQSYGYVTWEDDIWSEPAYRSDRYWDYERDRRYRDAFRHQERHYRDDHRVPERPRNGQADRERELQRQRDQLEAQRRAEERVAAERAARNLGNSYRSGSSHASSNNDDAREAARRVEEAESRRRAAEEQASDAARRRAEEDKNRQRQREVLEREERTRHQTEDFNRRMEETRRQAQEDKRRQAEELARDREEQSRRQADEARRRAEDGSRRQAQQEARDREEQSRRQADEARRRAEDDSRRQTQQEARERDERAGREAEQARRAAQESQPLKDRSNPSQVRPD